MTGAALGRLARQALIEEVETAPKPGLVDPETNGAHRDMDLTAFQKSAAALEPWFAAMADLGLTLDGTPETLFLALRPVGVQAEQAMYAATGGVNTHKGLIFTLGIFCGAAGRCLREQIPLTEEALRDMEQQMVVRILTNELGRLRTGPAATHGVRNLQQYGASGIRGEAIRGYPAVWTLALPVLRRGRSEGRDWNQTKLQALLSLMAKCEDSNILARKNPAALKQVQSDAAAILSSGGAYGPGALDRLRRLDADYTRLNISPGGCADLLATAIFMDMLLPDMGAAGGCSRGSRGAAVGSVGIEN